MCFNWNRLDSTDRKEGTKASKPAELQALWPCTWHDWCHKILQETTFSNMFQATILLWTVCYIAQAFFDWRSMQLIVLNQAKLMQGILHITMELAYLFHSYDQTDCLLFFGENNWFFFRNSNVRFDLENSYVKTLQWVDGDGVHPAGPNLNFCFTTIGHHAT